MPYLLPGDRGVLSSIEELEPWSAGELNYCFTRLVDNFLKHQGMNYSRINEAIGALECAKLELYRRIAGPYEDTKIASNGDAYSKENLT